MIGSPERVTLAHDPESDQPEKPAVEFRLTYEGILLGASRSNSRAKHKHEIRKVFHKQLKRLFQVHPAFAKYRWDQYDENNQMDRVSILGNQFNYEQVINNYERAGFRFFPLATRHLTLQCRIDILFLRPDVPGSVISSGDIDNRLKTIFDALRLPRDRSETGDMGPSDDENPFFCLLEDDSLISHAAVETDTLLQPTGDTWERNDARLVITVRLTPYRVTMFNLSFG